MPRKGYFLVCAIPFGLYVAFLIPLLYNIFWEGSGLMVSALDSEASDAGSSPGRGHCVVSLGKTLYSHNASLHLGV